MERQFASTELYALEDNALAVENAISVLKARLAHAPQAVVNDVIRRCDPDTHQALIDSVSGRGFALPADTAADRAEFPRRPRRIKKPRQEGGVRYRSCGRPQGTGR